MLKRYIFALGLAALLLVAALPGAASASGTPDLQLSGGPAPSVLYGNTVPVSLTASLPAGAPKGYNLAFRTVLPAGVRYVPGSAGALDGEPTILTGSPTTGKTTLIWENVDDLVASSSHTLSFSVAYNDTSSAGSPKYDVGDTLPIDTGAYISTQPRDETDFDSTGHPVGPGPGTYTGRAEQSTNTTLSAIKVTKSEPHPEGEIPRGLHDHQTVYTLKVANNGVNPTNGVSLEDYLPAGLEFLGCAGTPDHTTDAPTNPGSDREYAGAPNITVAHPTAGEGCVAPDLVETVNTDPDGAGPLPAGVYTHIKWNSIGSFAANGTKSITYAAAIPIRENTLDWNGAAAGIGTTPPTTGAQAANLDNNSGPETSDEQPMLNGALVAGTYQAPSKPGKTVGDEGTLLRTAEDIAIQKSGDNTTLNQGDLTKWTLDVETSEYRTVDDVVVHDVVPNGLCPLDTSGNRENPADQKSECDAVAGHGPSAPYTQVAEQPGGTYDVTWDKSTVPALAHLDPSSTRQITFWTRTRDHYQSDFHDAAPILSQDAVTNNVATSGVDFIRIGSDGRKIAHDEVDGQPDTDVSGAGKQAGGPVIEKTVAAHLPASGNCNDLAAAGYGKTVPVYGPGDQVCWKLRLVFPQNLNTTSQDVLDVLPSGLSYIPGSSQTTTNNTVPVGAVDSSVAGRLSWSIGTSNDVDHGGQVFEVTFKSTVGSPSGHHSGDVEGNLMKFSYVNTAGTAFPLRDRADFSVKLPELSLAKDVRKLGDAGYVDDRGVQGGDTAEYRVAVTNGGTADASSSRAWDVLPAGIACGDLVPGSISDNGMCNLAANRIEWAGVAVAHGATKNLSYQVNVPANFSPGEAFINTAGVVEFTYTANDGTPYQLIPANDVVKDPALPGPNAPKAQDTAKIHTADATVAKTRTTSVAESGNDGSTAATIGETVHYTVTTTIPQGTTMYGSPTVVDDLGARQSYVAGTLAATLNGTPLPTGGLSIGESGNVITTHFPGTYTNAAGSGDDVLGFTFDAKVLDVNANTRGGSLPNTATLAFNNETGQPTTRGGSTSTTIVEPKIGVSKSHSPSGRVSPGQIVDFSVTASTSSGTAFSPGHDVNVVDTVPVGTDPVDGSGNPIADGGTVPASGGIWNAGARTITWNSTTTPALATILPGANVAMTYKAKLESAPVAGQTYTNNVDDTTSSLLGGVPGERTSTSSTGTTAGDYKAHATDMLSVVLPAITKSVTPDNVTIGDKVAWTVHVTLPKNVQYFDSTVVDTLPDGVDFDAYGAATCTSGCTGAEPAIATFPVTTAGTGKLQAAWFLGDLAATGSDRTYDLVIKGHVRDTYRNGGAQVLDTQTLTNAANVRTDRANKVGPSPSTVPGAFDDTTPDATAVNHVVEPKLGITKSADKGPYVNPGDHVTYTVKVKNNGTSTAYDTVVDDQPDSDLTNVTLGAGAGYNTDGWTAADPHMRWVVTDPVAPGDTVTLTYSADVKPSASLHAATTIDNTAKVSQYYGVPAATRSADGFTYRHYMGPTSSVSLTPDFPALTLDKTTGASGFPDQADAEVGQPFVWRVKVTNNSHVAIAKSVHVLDTLPKNWTYVPGTSSYSTGGGSDPSVTPLATGDKLSWAGIADLAPRQSIIVAFSATPTAAAKTDPGNGPSHPHVNAAVADANDATGASGNADGPYTSNTDTAKAILNLPALNVDKTPDHGAAVAGQSATFTVKVKNTGLATARNTTVHDVLPAGIHYTPGAATASPATGFSETGASGATIDWKLGPIAPGATTTITVPVTVDASVAPSTLVNTATAHDVDAPADASDTGSLDVAAKADLKITKTDSPDPVFQGSNLTYTLKVDNLGPSDARSVTVTDPLPAGTTFVSASPGCTSAAGTVTCALGTLAANGSQTLTVVVKVDPNRTTPLHNTAHVGSTTPDPNPGNNDDSADTNVLARADVSIHKTADTSTAIGGDTVTYTLTAHNGGPGVAQHVTVADDLPDGVTFDSIGPSAPTCSQAAGNVSCDLGDLAPDETRTIKVKVKVDGLPAQATPGTGDHLVPIEKAEGFVAVQPGQTTTQDLSCPTGKLASDGMTRIDDGVDFAAVSVLESRSTGPGTYRFTVRNDASIQAQIHLFVVCLPATTTEADGHSHALHLGDPITASRPVHAGQREHFDLECGNDQVAVAPGIVFSGGATGHLALNEPTGAHGQGRLLDVVPESDGTVEVSIRCLNRFVDVANGHTHELKFTQLARTVTVPAGQTVSEPVICPDDAKGVEASWDLPEGVKLIGHDPQPKTRVFKLSNTTGSDLQATIDLQCLGDRTGPAVELVDVVNTATIATTTPDPDMSNNTDSATVSVQRAPGSATPTPPAPPASGSGGAAPAPSAPAPSSSSSPVSPDVAASPAPDAPAAGGSTPPSSSKPADTGPTVAADVALAVTKRTASVTLTCPDAASCSGTVSLVIAGKTVGSAPYVLKPRTSKTIKIKVSKSAKKLLKRAKGKAQVKLAGGSASRVKIRSV